MHDPWADPEEAEAEFGFDLVAAPSEGAYDGIVLAVAHDAFRKAGVAGLRRFGRAGHVLYDVKHLLAPGESDLRL